MFMRPLHVEEKKTNKENKEKWTREKMKRWGGLTFQLSSRSTQHSILCFPIMKEGKFGCEWCREATQMSLRIIDMYHRICNLTTAE